MKQPKEIQLASTLLVACPEYCAGGEFNYIDRITGSNGKVTDVIDVVVLNCNSAEEIPAFLDKTLTVLKELPKTDVVQNNISFMEKMKSEIGTIYQKDVPEGLIAHICNSARMELGKNKMLYLTGVTSIS